MRWQLASAQFKVASTRSEKPIINYSAFHSIFETFSQSYLGRISNVRLTVDDPLSHVEGRSSGASSYHASLLHAIGGVMPNLFLRPQIVSRAPQQFRSSETQATHGGGHYARFGGQNTAESISVFSFSNSLFLRAYANIRKRVCFFRVISALFLLRFYLFF